MPDSPITAIERLTPQIFTGCLVRDCWELLEGGRFAARKRVASAGSYAPTNLAACSFVERANESLHSIVASPAVEIATSAEGLRSTNATKTEGKISA